MTRLHLLIGVLDVEPGVLEDLLVGEHPVSIEKEKNWRPLEHVDTVDCEFVIECGWLSNLVSNNESLANVLVQEVEGCDREEDRHTNTVHHGNIHNVEDA